MDSVTLYSDGACSGNPGPGGWGCVLLSGPFERRMSGYEAHTTNNRMEMLAIIEGLKALKRPCRVAIYTDSQYVKNAFTEGWLNGWQRNGWKTKSGDDVKNKDLWLVFLQLQTQHHLDWHWVKGHAGNPLNEACDALARQAITQRAGVNERTRHSGKDAP